MIQNVLLTAGYYLFEFISMMLIVNVILSWVRPNPSNPLVRFVYGLTEPILTPIRRFAVIGPMDLSAIAALLILQIIIFPLYKWIILAIF